MLVKLGCMFVVGLAILVVAIALNVLATQLHIKTWYDFAQQPKDTNLISYIWLFAVYPLALGATAYATLAFLNHLQN